MPTGPTKIESSEVIPQEVCSVTQETLSFRFANLCGAPYSGGSVVFSSDGNCLFSPVSNRVMITDLASSRTSTAVPEMRSTTSLLVPMPAGKLGLRIVLAVDIDGFGVLFEAGSGVVLNRINFKGKVRAAAFSLDGQYLATAVGRRIKVWHSASVDNNWQFVLSKQFAGHIGEVTCLGWSADQLLVSGGSDSLVRVWSLNFEDRPHAILNEHSQAIVGVYFWNGGVVAVNRAGTIIVWTQTGKAQYAPKEEKGCIQSGVGYVTSASFDSFSGVLVLGLSGGAFSLFEISTLSALQSLSVGSAVTSVSLSYGGDWVAVGVEEAGQLMVWEWRAENFVFKQQGHHDGVNCVAISGSKTNTQNTDLLETFSSSNQTAFAAAGGLMATGGVEGKVKLWHSLSGFCFATLADHTSSVEAVQFTPQGNAILSASMDGSVRAYDLLRYRNFRTFTAPDARVQFGSLAIDPSGELVAAGSANGSYAIYLWSLQTGQCLDILTGHEARISSLRFASDGSTLVSTSWDASMKVWNVFGHRNKGGAPEALLTQREVTCAAFDPIDGSVLAAATMSGHITFWDVRNGIEVGAIEGVRDIASGRKEGQKFAPGALRGKKSRRDASGTEVNLNQHFTALQYGGAAGRWLAAVSKSSAFLCIYDPLEKTLISRIALTTHAGLSGVKQFLNSKFDLADSGIGCANDGYDELGVAGKRFRGMMAAAALPGVVRGDMRVEGGPSWRVNDLAVANDGIELVVATSEGAFVLSLAATGFKPSALSESVSHAEVWDRLSSSEFPQATIAALSLGESASFRLVFDSVPMVRIAGCVSQIPVSLFAPLLTQLAVLLHPVEGSDRVERALAWVTHLLKLQFNELQRALHGGGRELRAALCSLLQHVQSQSSALGRLLRENFFALSFLQGGEGEEEVGPEEPETVDIRELLTGLA